MQPEIGLARVGRKLRFESDAAVVLPDLSDLVPDGGRWETADYGMASLYFDTADGHLRQLGVTLRFRAHGPAAGWFLKVPGDPPRTMPDERGPAKVPDALAEMLWGITGGGADLAAVAEVTVHRTLHRLLTEGNELLAEMNDDLVGANARHGRRQTSWREAEVKIYSAEPPWLADKLGERLASSATPLEGVSHKLQRLFGRADTWIEEQDLSTIGGMTAAYVSAQCETIVLNDVGIRLDEPVVRRTRIAIRRLRSALKVFSPLFDAGQSAALVTELVWFAGLLGNMRNYDVLRERLRDQLAQLAPEQVVGTAAEDIETISWARRSKHRSVVEDAMVGKRYRRLLSELMRWRTSPPLTAKGRKPGSKAATYLSRAETKMRDRLATAGGDIEALHDARKAAKRWRYATELSAAAFGEEAVRIIEDTTALQNLLGEHQDSVVSAAFLKSIGAAARAANSRNGITYDLLIVQEAKRAEDVRQQIADYWT